MRPQASNNCSNYPDLARSHLINVVAASVCRGAPALLPMAARRHSAVATALHVCGTASMRRICLAMIAGVLCSVIATQAQEPVPKPAPTPQRLTATPPPGVTIEEVIVTGSNIPTAEEVGRQPVYVLNRDLISQLGVHSATDLILKLPMVTGPSLNENLNFIGDCRTEIDLRGLFSKETLVLQDGRRLATDGFVGYDVGRNFIFTPTVDLNLFPIGLIDHIDVLGTTRPPFTAVTRSLEFLTFG